MKVIKHLLFVAITMLPLLATAEITDADRKWAAVVEKMIADGQRTFSTPSEQRVALARQSATKLGYKCDVAKTADGFRIVVTQAIADLGK